jgi:hypothetical protein
MLRRLFNPVWFVCGLLILTGSASVGAEESELVIVKFGKLSVKSTVSEAKVYVDDMYKGHADSLIEDVLVGEHVISCRTETQSVSGRFTIKKDEVVKLEARFNEGKLVAVAEREKIEKAEAEKKVKAQAPAPAPAPKPEKPKKPVVEAKKEERRSPEEERRALHLNVVKVFFEDIDAQEVLIKTKVNPTVVSKYIEKKDQTGKYYRTKKDLLLCDAGPCEQHWSTTFVYTDEKGESDTFGLTWKQTIFNGITPAGTSKRELLWCLNAACKNLVDATVADTPQTVDLAGYHLIWTRSSLIIRQSDIMKEIVDAGGSLEAY